VVNSTPFHFEWNVKARPEKIITVTTIQSAWVMMCLNNPTTPILLWKIPRALFSVLCPNYLTLMWWLLLY